MSISWKSILIFFFFFLFLFQFCKSSSELEFPCDSSLHRSYPFCNTSLSITARAQSILSLLTLQEKIQQLSNNASSIPRLGIPSYQWWSEGLHGIATNGPGVSFDGPITSATTFPQVLVTAASFNRTLWFLIGSAIAVEARAMFNVGQCGLTVWAPNINIFRDPRWGRGQETPGEDPMVASAYSIEFVRGLQGGNWKTERVLRDGFGEKGKMEEDDGMDSLMVSACCKHFTAYDLEKWKNFSRYTFDAVVTEQDLGDTYQPPFRSCIQQGKASCLMCSYNAVNGVPACANPDLLQQARNDWGLKGYITSDCDAVATVFEYQKYTDTREDAIADVLKAGMDINCGTFMLRNTKSAINQGKVKEEELDSVLLNLFSVQIRLGLFDGNPREGKFGDLGAQNVCTAQHKTLALEAARQGIVLLKNQDRFLPLDKNAISSLTLIGSLANNASKLLGGYAGVPCSQMRLVEGFQEYVETIFFASGCLDVPCASDNGFDEAILISKQADFVIVVAGLDSSQETEDLDRVSLLLPGKQMDLVSSVASVSKKPIILVLVGGGPLDISFAKKDSRVASILWIGYPGEAGGKALAEVIFGDYNPGGRLPVTWYPESLTNVPMNDMHMRADPSRGYPGRTYRFYTGDSVYGFGQGLSYTSFKYKLLSAPKKLSLSGKLDSKCSRRMMAQVVDGVSVSYMEVEDVESCDLLRFHVKLSVSNIGEFDGSNVVMLFSEFPEVLKGTPQRQLIGFDRLHVKRQQSAQSSILVDPCNHLSMADEYGKRVIPLGDHIISLGDLHHIISIQVL
ncbi:probable beta-D-xylosidase 6 isoform X1 [Cucurbita maxima]|uniref:Probable beta-D-xylosidase 6 isoform X1 n=1 Tax=Cucurbita maxima TaxID=3661 RepID=A0A6J1IJX6_CUCMA|nr:probable beta-D-xylosidase 6 isoform X1 [Cucurbita maxima]